MTCEQIEDKIGKKVMLTATNGNKFFGIITNTEGEFDTSSRKEEIEMDLGNCYLGIPFDEIEKIIVIE